MKYLLQDNVKWIMKLVAVAPVVSGVIYAMVRLAAMLPN